MTGDEEMLPETTLQQCRAHTHHILGLLFILAHHHQVLRQLLQHDLKTFDYSINTMSG